MNKQKENAQKVLSTLVSKMIDRDTYEWPPKCSFLTYRPLRPASMLNKTVLKKEQK